MKKLINILLIIIFITLPKTIKAKTIECLVVKTKGSVLILPPKSKNWIVPHKWMELKLKTKIKTLNNSYIDILINRKALVRIKDNSEISIISITKKIEKLIKQNTYLKKNKKTGTVIKMFKGKAFFVIDPQYPQLPFIVETPIGIAGVAGTKFIVDLSKKGECFVAVWRGAVVFYNINFPKHFVLIEAGKYSLIKKKRIPHKPKPLNNIIKQRYKEIEKLHLTHFIIDTIKEEPGSKYKGNFTRGYSPTIITTPATNINNDMTKMIDMQNNNMDKKDMQTKPDMTNQTENKSLMNKQKDSCR